MKTFTYTCSLVLSWMVATNKQTNKQMFRGKNKFVIVHCLMLEFFILIPIGNFFFFSSLFRVISLSLFFLVVVELIKYVFLFFFQDRIVFFCPLSVVIIICLQFSFFPFWLFHYCIVLLLLSLFTVINSDSYSNNLNNNFSPCFFLFNEQNANNSNLNRHP